MMKYSFPPISFCIGVYNEEDILLQSLHNIKMGLENIVGKGNYEIIVVDNGSTDKTKELLKTVTEPSIKIAFVKKKGLGLALKKAISLAKNEHIVLSAIDLPFGFGDLEIANKYWHEYDLISGSKAHPDSKIFIPLKRKIMSFIYRRLSKILFNIKIKDTQGSLFLKKSKILPFLDFCNSENAFFSTQIVIYGQLYGLKMKEIPVTMRKKEMRPSKIHIMRDGSSMLFMLFRESILYKKRKYIYSLENK